MSERVLTTPVPREGAVRCLVRNDLENLEREGEVAQAFATGPRPLRLVRPGTPTTSRSPELLPRAQRRFRRADRPHIECEESTT